MPSGGADGDSVMGKGCMCNRGNLRKYLPLILIMSSQIALPKWPKINHLIHWWQRYSIDHGVRSVCCRVVSIRAYGRNEKHPLGFKMDRDLGYEDEGVQIQVAAVLTSVSLYV
jgi:hypothetical protein